MSFRQAEYLARNLRSRALDSGDPEMAEMAHALEELASGLEDEIRSIKNVLQEIQHHVRNLR